MIKISGKWIDQTQKLVVVIFHSFLFKELAQTKHFFSFSTYKQMRK